MHKFPEIVMIESGPTDSFSKIAHILRKNGFNTTLITLTNPPDSEFIKNSYNKIIYFDSKFFKINLKSMPKIAWYALKKVKSIFKAAFQLNRLSPDIVIARATPSWLCYLSMKFFRKSCFIYFPYDIRSFTYKDLAETDKNRIPKFEIKAERYCFENADGIIHKGFEDELTRLNEKILGKNIKIKEPTIQFLPYCLKELMVPINKNGKISKKEGGIHLVYIGHVATNEDWLENIQKIVNQKIHLHVYGKTANFSKAEGESHFRNFYKKLSETGYFHIHEAVDQKAVAGEISKYDYGFFSFNKEKNYFVATSVGNKFSSYLEAGIPVICLDNYGLVKEIIEKYKVGFSIPMEELDKLKSRIEKNRKNNFSKNIEKTRNEFSMEEKVKNLKEFFQKSIQYKKSRKNL